MIENKFICTWCHKREKVGYKYCEECKKEVSKEHDLKHQKKRRAAKLKMCVECGVVKTNTKYCRSCAQWVRKRNTKLARQQKNKVPGSSRKSTPRTDVKINKKWLVRGPISNSNKMCNITGGSEC